MRALVQQNGTIAAIATPPGVGGIAVVRISGSGAYSVAEAVFRPKNPNKSLRAASGYTALFGHFVEDGALCDEVVALCFRAPHSYTGEDVVELSCHGGSACCAPAVRLAQLRPGRANLQNARFCPGVSRSHRRKL